MTSTLRAAASAHANGGQAATDPPPDPAEATTVELGEPADVEYTDPITDPPQVPVHVAWARVKADVQAIAKRDRRNDTGGRYMFRGVDTVIEHVGPAIRRHGIDVLPVQIVSATYRDVTTKSGGSMRECTVVVEWMVVGPMGDTMPKTLQSTGEATDSGDKSTAKAMSVAQRVLYLTSLHVPTGDPTVDAGQDRGARPLPKPTDYRDELLDKNITYARLKTIYQEIRAHGLAGSVVTNETGEDEQLGVMVDRIGREHAARRTGGAS